MPGSSELPEGLARVSELQSVVQEVGACALPGVTVRYDNFMHTLWHCVAKGHVKHDAAVFVADGLRWGFKAGIDVSRLHGHRWFTNYKSALDNREAVKYTRYEASRGGGDPQPRHVDTNARGWHQGVLARISNLSNGRGGQVADAHRIQTY